MNPSLTESMDKEIGGAVHDFRELIEFSRGIHETGYFENALHTLEPAIQSRADLRKNAQSATLRGEVTVFRRDYSWDAADVSWHTFGQWNVP